MNFKIITAFKAVSVIVITWGGFCSSVYSQDKHHEVHDEHGNGGFELGLSVGYVYLKEDKEEGANLHLHLMKRLSGEGVEKYLSLGFGVETIIADEKHYAAMLSLAVHPTENIIVSISPGLEWAKHAGQWEREYVTHLEATYIYEGNGFHYGPTVGYSKTQDEQHYTVGVHFGFPL